MDRRADPAQQRLASLAMLILTAFTAVVLGMSHSLSYGRIGLALAAALAPAVLLGVWTQKYINAASVVALVGTLAPLLVAGMLFTDLTVLNFSLIAAAPLGLIIGWRWVAPGWAVWVRVGISLTLMTLPLATAVVLQWPDFRESLRVAEGY
jgi:hypothetical protein